MKIIIALLLFITLYADTKNMILDLYKNERYAAACNLGFDNFQKYKHDEQFLSLYGFACLKSDYIDRLALPAVMLKFSKEARANAAYFSTILMQKKLLYYSMVDGYKLQKFTLPTTDHILSKVFDLYTGASHLQQNSYSFKDMQNQNIEYKLHLLKDTNLDKVVIEVYENNHFLSKHIYW